METYQSLVKKDIMSRHRYWINQGKYWQARRLYQLLKTNHVNIGLSDVDEQVNNYLETLGLPSSLNTKYGNIHYHLR